MMARRALLNQTVIQPKDDVVNLLNRIDKGIYLLEFH